MAATGVVETVIVGCGRSALRFCSWCSSTLGCPGHGVGAVGHRLGGHPVVGWSLAGQHEVVGARLACGAAGHPVGRPPHPTDSLRPCRAAEHRGAGGHVAARPFVGPVTVLGLVAALVSLVSPTLAEASVGWPAGASNRSCWWPRSGSTPAAPEVYLHDRRRWRCSLIGCLLIAEVDPASGASSAWVGHWAGGLVGDRRVS